MAISGPKASNTHIGTAVHFQASGITTPGLEQVLISQVIPASITRYLSQVIVVCRIEGMFKIMLDGQMIGSGRTGAVQPNVSFGFAPSEELFGGSNLEVLFEARANSPAVSVECFIHASDLIE
jgi:hypothetical protein